MQSPFGVEHGEFSKNKEKVGYFLRQTQGHKLTGNRKQAFKNFKLAQQASKVGQNKKKKLP